MRECVNVLANDMEFINVCLVKAASVTAVGVFLTQCGYLLCRINLLQYYSPHTSFQYRCDMLCVCACVLVCLWVCILNLDLL